MKKLMIFTQAIDSYENKSFVEAAKLSGISVIFCNYRDVGFEYTKSKFSIVCNKQILDFKKTGVILDKINEENHQCRNVQAILIRFFKQNNIQTLNIDNLYIYNSFENILNQVDLLKTYTDKLIYPIYYFDKNHFYSNFKGISLGKSSFPMMMNPIDLFSSQPKQFIESKESLQLQIYNNHIEKYYFQKYIENEGTIKVIILGGKLLSAIHLKAHAQIVRGISLPAANEIQLNPNISKHLITLTKRLDADFMIYDLILTKNTKDFQLIHCNRFYDFRQFDILTGKGVAWNIINFMQGN